MKRAYNFNPGPSMLPDEVLKEAQEELLSWHGTGMSIMEMGHRGAEFNDVAQKSEADFRELMEIPDNYKVIFVPGGATAHFAMVPLNLFSKENMHADYIDTGIWSEKAIAEAKRYGDINIAAGLHKEGKISIAPQKEWKLNSKAAYLHYTPNETIQGIEFDYIPKTNVPLVADMSSMILSRYVDVSKYGVIYAGAQKNMGQAGITAAIIREDLIKEPLPGTPSLYSYKLQSENKSFYNTPPTFSWYLMGLVFAWMKKHGGVKKFEEINIRKAKKLYHLIDSHTEFYINTIDPSCRSRMNVVWDLINPELTEKFLKEADKAGLKNLKGHRLAGGARASIYNAMPEEGVDALCDFMKDFAKRNG